MSTQEKTSNRKTSELRIEAAVDNLDTVLGFLEEKLEAAACPLKTQMQIAVAAEEIFVNVAQYAYAPNTGEVTVGVEISDEPRAVTVSFTDSGVPFNPLARQDPDVSLSAEEREAGGLGIFMTKKLLDQLRYEYRDGQNVLSLTKRL